MKWLFKVAPRLIVVLLLVSTVLLAVPGTAMAAPSWRIQRCLNRLNAALSDPALTTAQKDYVRSLCDGDIAAEAVAEPQGAMAPEIFPDHYYIVSEPTKPADRFGHSLHCMDLSAERFTLVDIPSNPANTDLTKPGGAAPLNYAGEFLLAEIDGQVRLFNRVVFWQVRPDNEPVLIKHQILFPGNSNTTVARIPNAPQHVPMSVWTEIEPTIMQAWPASMNPPDYEQIIPGRIMNLRTWYGDTNCHDKRGETRIPNLVLDYATSHGFAGGAGALSQPTRIRLQSSGDPYVGSNWRLDTAAVTLANTQTTNGFKWFYAADVQDTSGDVQAPQVAADHLPGASFTGPNVTLTGTAMDNVGVDSVSVTIQNPDGDFLQSDGSFAAARIELPTVLGAPGATATTWSIGLNLPDNSYDLEIHARDAAGNARVESSADFVVGGAVSDDTPPSPPTMDHAPQAVLSGPDVTLTGAAADNVGVTSVRIKVKNRSNGLWLQADGSFASGVAWHNTTVNDVGDPNVTWSVALALPEGRFNPVAEAFDAAGNSRIQATWTPFEVVGDPPPDAQAPVVTADHSPGQSFGGPSVTLTGDATDNVGVATVTVSIANSTGDFLQSNGTFAPAPAQLSTVLGTPGGTATSWSIGVSLPNDVYTLTIYARDAAGNEGTNSTASFEVSDSPADDTPPAAPTLDHAPQQAFAGPAVTLTGQANDNVGVTSVRVKIKNRNNGLWLQADGTFASTIAWHQATVDDMGATDVAWSLDVVLPNGRYNPVSEAFDAAGNSRTQTTWSPFSVF